MTLSRGKLGLSIAPGLLVGLLWIWAASWLSSGMRRFTLFDDAMISMTYARTLAETGELVWYPGAPRVEGITNPLWTAFLALIHVMGLDGSAASLVVALTGLAFVIASAVMVGLLAHRIIRDEPWVAYGSAAATALSFPALFWATRGMEVGLQLFLLMTMVLLVVVTIDHEFTHSRRVRPLLYIGMFLVVLCGIWTRIDFIVLTAAMVVWLLVTSRRFPGQGSTIVTITAAGLFAVATQTVWRVAYYGQLFPNTYYLKVEGHTTLERLLRGQWTDGKLTLIAALTVLGVVAIFLLGTSSQKRIAGLLGSIALAAVVYSTYVGGDAWDEYTFGNRYVTPVYVLGIVVFLAGTSLLLSRGFRWLPFVLAALAGIILLPLGLRALIRGSIRIGEDFPGSHWWAIASFAVLAALVLTYFLLMRMPKPSVTATKVTAVSLAILASGSLSWIGVAVNGGPKVLSDQRNTESGLSLKAILPQGTTAAVVFAGAPVYYSELPAIDMLGKSDPFIAQSDPKLDFKPGHDKFDYDYSIGQLRPDVILDLFVPPDGIEQQLSDWGYTWACIGSSLPSGDRIALWVNSNSPVAGQFFPCS